MAVPETLLHNPKIAFFLFENLLHWSGFFYICSKYIFMNSSNQIALGIVKAIFILLGVGLGLWLLFELKTLLVYIIISLVIALVTSPIIRFLKRKLKFSNFWATLTTIGLLLFLAVSLILMFVPLFTSQSQNLSLLNTRAIQQNFYYIWGQMENFAIENNIPFKDFLTSYDYQSQLDFQFIPSFINSILSALGSFSIGFISVVFISFFILKESDLFMRTFKNVLPENRETQILNSFDKITNLLSRYFAGLVLQLLVVFILYYIVLLIFKVENSFVIAFLCALLNIIPYLGPIIGMLLAGLLTMISRIGLDFQTEILPVSIYVMIGFLLVQMVDNYVNQPLIFSKSVKSHPLEIFLVILAAGFLSGIVGMIIAVPFYTIVKVIAKEFFPDNKVVKVLARKL
jgi:predicted PurR-regulated permease PerM